MVQIILNPEYLPITDVSEIGLFGEILSDESVGVFIQPFLPRMARAAKIGFCCQWFSSALCFCQSFRIAFIASAKSTEGHDNA